MIEELSNDTGYMKDWNSKPSSKMTPLYYEVFEIVHNNSPIKLKSIVNMCTVTSHYSRIRLACDELAKRGAIHYDNNKNEVTLKRGY